MLSAAVGWSGWPRPELLRFFRSSVLGLERTVRTNARATSRARSEPRARARAARVAPPTQMLPLRTAGAPAAFRRPVGPPLPRAGGAAFARDAACPVEFVPFVDSALPVVPMESLSVPMECDVEPQHEMCRDAPSVSRVGASSAFQRPQRFVRPLPVPVPTYAYPPPPPPPHFFYGWPPPMPALEVHARENPLQSLAAVATAARTLAAHAPVAQAMPCATTPCSTGTLPVMAHASPPSLDGEVSASAQRHQAQVALDPEMTQPPQCVSSAQPPEAAMAPPVQPSPSSPQRVVEAPAQCEQQPLQLPQDGNAQQRVDAPSAPPLTQPPPPPELQHPVPRINSRYRCERCEETFSTRFSLKVCVRCGALCAPALRACEGAWLMRLSGTERDACCAEAPEEALWRSTSSLRVRRLHAYVRRAQHARAPRAHAHG